MMIKINLTSKKENGDGKENKVFSATIPISWCGVDEYSEPVSFILIKMENNYKFYKSSDAASIPKQNNRNTTFLVSDEVFQSMLDKINSYVCEIVESNK